jgi:hypothetical protein
MDDTITLNTRILLATKGFHDEALVHGGYNKAESTQRSKNKRNMTEVLGRSRQDQMNIYSRLVKLWDVECQQRSGISVKHANNREHKEKQS